MGNLDSAGIAKPVQGKGGGSAPGTGKKAQERERRKGGRKRQGNEKRGGKDGEQREGEQEEGRRGREEREQANTRRQDRRPWIVY